MLEILNILSTNYIMKYREVEETFHTFLSSALYERDRPGISQWVTDLLSKRYGVFQSRADERNSYSYQKPNFHV
jgi:hypothetical protein